MAYASLATEVGSGLQIVGEKEGDVKLLKTTKETFENYSRKSFSRTGAKPSAVCSMLRKNQRACCPQQVNSLIVRS